MLTPTESTTCLFPPNHHFWTTLGVTNQREAAELGYMEVIKLAASSLRNKHLKYGLQAIKNQFERQGASDKMKCFAEIYKEREPSLKSSEEDINEYLYLNDGDRLTQLCESVRELDGIPMNSLTAGDSKRILDNLHALDLGYDFSSKTGISMKDYYGDKADSEKTQRQRLFKKLRATRDKGK